MGLNIYVNIIYFLIGKLLISDRIHYCILFFILIFIFFEEFVLGILVFKRKKILFFSVLATFLMFLSVQSAFSKTIEGYWQTISDKSGNPSSVFRIQRFKVKDKEEYFGKVIKICPQNGNKPTDVCKNCTGDVAYLHNKPIEGMTILFSLIQQSKNIYSNGEILDPKEGKLYRVTLTLEQRDKLKVRGYIGFSWIGRTQYWYRLPNQHPKQWKERVNNPCLVDYSKADSNN
jgi:uncharacterized protein (DUF2147 family)